MRREVRALLYSGCSMVSKMTEAGGGMRRLWVNVADNPALVSKMTEAGGGMRLGL